MSSNLDRILGVRFYHPFGSAHKLQGCRIHHLFSQNTPVLIYVSISASIIVNIHDTLDVLVQYSEVLSASAKKET